ncbi:hypothetical protein XAC301_07650 [Xanthomonas arboricola pv. corylina]|uniref:Uncharacterized protein n=1 Tax=Xanthomonas arboricola pv. corylina TaxID=487821 RepID=A0ABM8QTP0_9XANT|nr:hypothetical protein XAC301_07650 [Xanthomonas arboricola pv. corylina]CAE6714568.1 hypothetical protein XAC301_07650 [Xanthomonas arboricola pv. corylina]
MAAKGALSPVRWTLIVATSWPSSVEHARLLWIA